jgi:DNA-binding response OmpR family regulator
VSTKTPVILIVDDEPLLTEVFKDLFEDYNVEVLTANCGNEAIGILKKSEIDFVISDVKMANGDGIKLLRFVRNELSKTPPVLLVSGYTQYSELELMEMGAIGLLAKPMEFGEIVKIASEYLNLDNFLKSV